MKRQLSLGMLFARSALGRTVAVLAAMAAAQLVLAWVGLRDGQSVAETVLDGPWFRLCSALGLTGTVAMMMLSAGGFGSRCDYTVSRLPVRRWAVFLWAAGCAAALLILFWAVETAVCLGILRWQREIAPWAAANPQLALLTAYRSGLLHSLLPLRDGLRWVTTLLYFVSLAVLTGAWTLRAFGGKWSVLPLILAMAWWFDAGAVGSGGWALLLAAATVLLALAALWGDQEELP